MTEVDPKARLDELRERARQRIAEAPDYPDDPESLAEMAALAEAMWPLQVEAMLSTEQWLAEQDDDTP